MIDEHFKENLLSNKFIQYIWMLNKLRTKQLC